jgi:hypothetical protein
VHVRGAAPAQPVAEAERRVAGRARMMVQDRAHAGRIQVIVVIVGDEDGVERRQLLGAGGRRHAPDRTREGQG